MVGDAAWEVTVDGEVERLAYLPECDAVVVATQQELMYLSAGDGSVLASLQLDTPASFQSYRPALGLHLVHSDADGTHAVDTDQWTVAWQTSTGPIWEVEDGRGYCFDETSITAVDISDGSHDWTTELRQEFRFVGIVQDVVIVTVGDYSNPEILGFDAASGTRRWHAQEDYFDSVEVNSVGVIVQCRDREGTSNLYSVCQLNPINGKEHWFVDEFLFTNTAKEVDNLYVDYGGSKALGIRPQTGRIDWSVEHYDVEGMFFDDNDRLYVAAERDSMHDYILERYDPGSGRVKWSLETQDEVRSLMPVDITGRTELLVGTATRQSDQAFVSRVDADTGTLRWHETVNSAINDLETNATPVLASTSDGLYAFDWETGTLEWSFADKYPSIAAAADAAVAVRGGSECYLIDRSTGTVENVLDGPVTGGPDGIVHAVNDTVSAYSLTTGRATMFEMAPGPSPSNTQVFDGDSEATETNVYAGSSAGGSSAGGSGVSFCPECGADQSSYDNPSFCPECGSELP